jgi:hypothetical protein
MVKRIKKKIKVTPHTRYVISLAMVISAQYEPGRDKPFLLSPFDPPALLNNFFNQHFDIDLVSADRFIRFEEYRHWLSTVKPAEAMKAGMKTGSIHFPAVHSPETESASPDYLILPLLGAATDAEWEEQFDQWTEGFSEIQATIFRNMIEPILGMVPGIDKSLFMGPAPAKNINQVILYLHGRASDECQLNRWPAPPLFPILDFQLIEKLPVKSPVSF